MTLAAWLLPVPLFASSSVEALIYSIGQLLGLSLVSFHIFVVTVLSGLDGGGSLQQMVVLFLLAAQILLHLFLL